MKRKPAKQTTGTTEQGSALSSILQRLNGSADDVEGNDQLQTRLAEQVEELAFHGLEVRAIALLLDCDEALLNSEFTYALEHGRARWRKFLMEKLTEKVDEGEWPALKFALKNSCGMADNPHQAALQHEKLVHLRKQAVDAAARHQPQPREESAPADLVSVVPQSVQRVAGGKTHDSSLDLTPSGGADAPNEIAG